MSALGQKRTLPGISAAELRCPLQLDVLPVALIQQIIGEGGILMCGIGQFRIAR